ncbi:hypothetical protein QBC44DRAFT_249853 [Cladorrhinum sp. PSN332]|nr:hypothetical protein QBC44DRAFT_249853 [Cladorrhinum sp. PSN332]
MTSRLFILVVLRLIGTCSALSRCYYPNGREATGDFPCDPDAEASPCCGGGFGTVCLFNKLCQSPDGNVIRGSCTDDQFGSASCPKFCLGANLGGTDLISCSNVTGNAASYCCDHTVNCCSSGVGRFDVLPADPHTWATWATASTRFVVVRALSTSTPTSAATITPQTGSTTASQPPSEATSTVPAPQQGGSRLSPAGYAGVGVGSVIGVLLIAAVVYLVLRLKKIKKTRIAPDEHVGAVAYGPPPPSTHQSYHDQDPPKELPQEPEPREVLGDHDWNQHQAVRAELAGHPYH